MTKEIYILTHKKIEYDLDLSKYIIIQCGAASNEKIYDVTDDIGNNISLKNNLYLETTGIYWIWQNSNADIKGQMQYRRFLSVNPEFVDKILLDYDIITANCLILQDRSIMEHYSKFHIYDDLVSVRDILIEYFPMYVNSFDIIMNGNRMYYSNSFICSGKLYDDICSFIFSVLFIFENRNKLYDPEVLDEHVKSKFIEEDVPAHEGLSMFDYQKRICGYLFERLFNVYVLQHKLRVYLCGNYLQMEDKMVM